MLCNNQSSDEAARKAEMYREYENTPVPGSKGEVTGKTKSVKFNPVTTEFVNALESEDPYVNVAHTVTNAGTLPRRQGFDVRPTTSSPGPGERPAATPKGGTSDDEPSLVEVRDELVKCATSLKEVAEQLKQTQQLGSPAVPQLAYGQQAVQPTSPRSGFMGVPQQPVPMNQAGNQQQFARRPSGLQGQQFPQQRFVPRNAQPQWSLRSVQASQFQQPPYQQTGGQVVQPMKPQPLMTTSTYQQSTLPLQAQQITQPLRQNGGGQQQNLPQQQWQSTGQSPGQEFSGNNGRSGQSLGAERPGPGVGNQRLPAPVTNGSVRPRTNSGNNVTCFLCGEIGHYKSHCPQRQNIVQQRAQAGGEVHVDVLDGTEYPEEGNLMEFDSMPVEVDALWDEYPSPLEDPGAEGELYLCEVDIPDENAPTDLVLSRRFGRCFIRA